MDDKKLEERLELLKESYDRLPTSLNTSHILKEIENPKSASQMISAQKKNINWQRVTAWIVSAAAILVFGLIGASFQVEKPSSIATQLENIDGEGKVQLADASQEFINRLKNNYSKEREKRREMLHLTEEEFSELPYIQQTDALYIRYTEESSFSLYYSVPSFSDSESLNIRYDELIHSLYLPSEMIQEVKSKGQKVSDEDTAEFFNAYSSKVKELKEYFGKKDKMTDEQLAALKKENLFQSSEETKIKYKMNEEQLSVLKNILAPSFVGYNYILEKEPFTYGGELTYSLNDSVAILMHLDMLLGNSSDLYIDKSLLKLYYTEIFYAVVKGTKDKPVFISGAVNKEYQDIWKDIVSESNSSNILILLNPIVNEFENSGWTNSDSWDALDYGDIDDSLRYW